MRLLEHFISINGEGIHAGYPTLFLRFVGCNLRCSYCDTKYSYDGGIEYDIEEILNIVANSKLPRITITGGEPLLQTQMITLCGHLIRMGYLVEMETNGSMDIISLPYSEKFTTTMDYKMASSGMEDQMRLENLKSLTKNDVIKFVCSNVEEVEKAFEIADKYQLKCTKLLSPVFGTIPFHEIVETMIKHERWDFRFQIQQHKVIWPPEMRGV